MRHNYLKSCTQGLQEIKLQTEMRPFPWAPQCCFCIHFISFHTEEYVYEAKAFSPLLQLVKYVSCWKMFLHHTTRGALPEWEVSPMFDPYRWRSAGLSGTSSSGHALMRENTQVSKHIKKVSQFFEERLKSHTYWCVGSARCSPGRSILLAAWPLLPLHLSSHLYTSCSTTAILEKERERW